MRLTRSLTYIIGSMLLGGCRAPDPELLQAKTTTVPVVLTDKTYSVSEFALNWTMKKNFGFAGSAGVFMVAGGENGLSPANETSIFKYDPVGTSFAKTIVAQSYGALGRSFFPTVASSFTQSATQTFALFGGAGFVEVTKAKGLRSDLLSVVDSLGGGLFLGGLEASGISARSGSCMVGLPGGGYFIFGGENLGTAVDGGVIFQDSKEILLLPASEAPPARWAHGCVYNPNDGLVYIFGGLTNSGAATSVFTFNRQTWRWGAVGDINPAKFGFYYYAQLGARLVVVSEGLSNHQLEASMISATGITHPPLIFSEGVFRSSSLPYGAGELAPPRQAGSFKGGCIVVPVTGSGGMPKLQEFCLQNDSLEATSALESLANQGVQVGVFTVLSNDFAIYVGSKSFYGDPLTGGRGVVLQKR